MGRDAKKKKKRKENVNLESAKVLLEGLKRI